MVLKKSVFRGGGNVDEVIDVATKVVERVLAVYNAEYITKCAANDPNSLLGLTKRLESALSKHKNQSNG